MFVKNLVLVLWITVSNALPWVIAQILILLFFAHEYEQNEMLRLFGYAYVDVTEDELEWFMTAERIDDYQCLSTFFLKWVLPVSAIIALIWSALYWKRDLSLLKKWDRLTQSSIMLTTVIVVILSLYGPASDDYLRFVSINGPAREAAGTNIQIEAAHYLRLF